eukprot:TRINITY_DN922_c0_g2_i1.p1 TRINITY_DN922_c0_g2~~TRINITY_DN922_c0_g2_i1.p1  ORF type:complete len:707 (+),score=192.97 TRINITY_DN922_c0_g2_i1:184-2304(+)
MASGQGSEFVIGSPILGLVSGLSVTDQGHSGDLQTEKLVKLPAGRDRELRGDPFSVDRNLPPVLRRSLSSFDRSELSSSKVSQSTRRPFLFPAQFSKPDLDLGGLADARSGDFEIECVKKAVSFQDSPLWPAPGQDVPASVAPLQLHKAQLPSQPTHRLSASVASGPGTPTSLVPLLPLPSPAPVSPVSMPPAVPLGPLTAAALPPATPTARASPAAGAPWAPRLPLASRLPMSTDSFRSPRQPLPVPSPGSGLASAAASASGATMMECVVDELPASAAAAEPPLRSPSPPQLLLPVNDPHSAASAPGSLPPADARTACPPPLPLPGDPLVSSPRPRALTYSAPPSLAAGAQVETAALSLPHQLHNCVNQVTPDTVAALLASGCVWSTQLQAFAPGRQPKGPPPPPLTVNGRRVLIVDCRFAYEYAGGHIEHALNVASLSELLDAGLLERPSTSPTSPPALGPADQSAQQSTVVIFHCEFSQLRGPTMWQQLRASDRLLNANSYPHLSWPDIYVLRGGYKAFYDSFPELCTPSAYVPMDSPAFAAECADGLRRVKSARSLKRSFSAPSCVRRSLLDEHLLQRTHTLSLAGRLPMASLMALSIGAADSAPADDPRPRKRQSISEISSLVPTAAAAAAALSPPEVSDGVDAMTLCDRPAAAAPSTQPDTETSAAGCLPLPDAATAAAAAGADRDVQCAVTAVEAPPPC